MVRDVLENVRIRVCDINMLAHMYTNIQMDIHRYLWVHKCDSS